MNNQDIKNLKKRYFIWLYKGAKEVFDKFERKFTQLDIDKDILDEMEKELLGSYLPHEKDALQKYINDFEKYIENKEKACSELRDQEKKINPEFIFSEIKLNAVEKAIIKEIGKRGLEEIKSLYEKEMTERILKNTQTH
ncbi:MAG: hypothetical protein PHR84_01460 [Candidatus Omnitrophica bacterium]|nr:hypothetical protein [Candidatus Omnitrophota bacterium]MDD5661217.1 hypothetical protein [Candidatus Omnitrophota bacterium]